MGYFNKAIQKIFNLIAIYFKNNHKQFIIIFDFHYIHLDLPRKI